MECQFKQPVGICVEFDSVVYKCDGQSNATIKSVDLLHLGLDKIMSVLSTLSVDATNFLRCMDTEHPHSMGNLFLFNSIHNFYTGKLIALTERASADMDIEHIH